MKWKDGWIRLYIDKTETNILLFNGNGFDNFLKADIYFGISENNVRLFVWKREK